MPLCETVAVLGPVGMTVEAMYFSSWSWPAPLCFLQPQPQLQLYLLYGKSRQVAGQGLTLGPLGHFN